MGKFSVIDILNAQSKEEAQHQNFNIRFAPIEKIRPSEMNKYGIRDIEELAANIELFGLEQSLTLRPIPNTDEFEIIGGERRYRACKLLYDGGNEKFAALPYTLSEQNDDVMAELELHFINSARNLTDYEKTWRAGRIKELLSELKKRGYKFKGRMREIVADILNVSPAQMGIMEKIDKDLSEDFKEEFRNQNIGITEAYELARLPEDEQAKVLQGFKKTGIVPSKPKEERQSDSTAAPARLEEAQAEKEEIQATKKPIAEDATLICGECHEKQNAGQLPDRKRIIRDLRSLAADLKNGGGGGSFDICGICEDAARLLMQDDILEDMKNG